MMAADYIIREKLKAFALAQLPITKGLSETITAKENAWWNTEHKMLPSRAMLALYYECFRIDGEQLDCMALSDLCAINFLTYGDKNIDLFWEEWKRVAMHIAHMIPIGTLTTLLIDKLAPSTLCKDELKAIKKIKVEEEFCIEVENIRKDLKNYKPITKVVNIIIPFFQFLPFFF